MRIGKLVIEWQGKDYATMTELLNILLKRNMKLQQRLDEVPHDFHAYRQLRELEVEEPPININGHKEEKE